MDNITICNFCGKVFEYIGLGRVKSSYCSKKCKYLAKKARHINVCSECGVVFIGGVAKTCSKECKKQHLIKTKKSQYPTGFKKCAYCLEIKPLDCFSKSSTALIGYGSYCRDCNKEKHLLKPRTKERMEYKRKQRIKLKQETGSCNTESDRKIRRRCEAKRRLRDKRYVLNCHMRSLMWASLHKRGISKNNISWKILVGYSVDDLYAHLERKFVEGMTWENQGQWHIDHIKPLVSFNYTTVHDEEFKQCWALSNLQPLWGPENISKGCRY